MRRSWLRLFWAGVVVAAAVAGYLVSSGLGERVLHHEIERQLGRILEGPVRIGRVDLALSEGLQVEAHDVEAWPARSPDEVPVLRASRVLAWIDLLDLLVGRLELDTLILEGPQLALVRDAEGHVHGPPLPEIRLPDEGADELPLAERLLRHLESLDPAAAHFAERFRVANHIELRDGTISWEDHLGRAADAAPEILRLELLDLVADRDWLSDAITIEAKGVLVDGRNAPFPIEIDVQREEDRHFDWRLAVSGLPLERAAAPLARIERIDRLSGTLDASIHLTRRDDGGLHLSVEGRIDEATLGLRGARNLLDREQAELHTELDFDAGGLRLDRAELQGERLGLALQGNVPRPLRPTARARLESRIRGIELDDVRRIARSLEGESASARSLLRLIERVEHGRIQTVEATGTASLRDWGDLLTGRATRLPDGFVLGGRFDRFSVGTGPEDRLESLEGHVEWVEDRIWLRDTNAVFRGAPLPTIDVTIEGVSHLASAREADDRVTSVPPPLPGIAPLMQILRPRDPDALPAVKLIGLAIDRLEHPIFRWPLEDLRVVVEPLRRGMQINVREGLWGGAGVTGEVVWFNDPRAPTVSATLTLAPGPTTPAGTESDASGERADLAETSIAASSPAAPSAHDPKTSRKAPSRWGSGRFEMEFRPRPKLPFARGSGFFRLEGDRLVANDIELDLDPGGQAALRGEVELADPESVGLDFSFALTDGQIGGLTQFVRLPEDLARGGIGATGSLAGRVRPDVSFIADLEGRIRAEAKDGKVRMGVPLLFRLAKATEGYNPFANEDELRFEAMTGTIGIDHGRLDVADFEIEGPLRVFANAAIDTNEKPGRIKAVVGIFLFRGPNQILETLPLVRSFLPGSERGLVGAYFEVKGGLSEPSVEALPMATLASAVPSAIKAPFKVLRLLFERGGDDS
ncbi:MAG: hypothetical protein KC616_14265 [Myxococcales bacterium]|nr:hypothetical protein [Myxococcales bacterium]